jgi:hypothetical protein
MKAARLALFLFVVMTCACATVDLVRSDPDFGSTHTFKAPYADVLQAVPKALHALNMTMLESSEPNSHTREIIAMHGASMFSWGEFVRVVVTEVDSGRTDVAVYTKRWELLPSGGRNWSAEVFLEIGKLVFGPTVKT